MASIVITGVGAPLSFAIGATVTLTAQPAGASSYAWELLESPTGSIATLTAPTAQSTDFVADIEGSYLVRVTVDGEVAQAIAAISYNTSIGAIRAPATGETFEVDSTEGWGPDAQKVVRLVAQLDAAVTALTAGSTSVWKSPVRAAADVNIALSGSLPLTLDGVVINNGDRVLLKSQSDASENGIYDATVSGTYTLARSVSSNETAEVTGMIVGVLEGARNARSFWYQAAVNPTVGVDALTFIPFGAGILSDNLAFKDSAVVASSATIADLANVSLTDFDGTAQGITLVEDDRVLVKNQSDPKENGIYVVGAGASPVPFTRARDAETGDALRAAAIFMEKGTHAETGWLQTADNITIGVDNITFIQFTGLGSITAGAGLSKSGPVLDVGDIGKGVQANADDLQVDASEIAGNGLQQTAGGGNEHLLSVQASTTSVSVDASGVKAAVSKVTEANPSNTIGDNQATGVILNFSPAAGSRVLVFLNGVGYQLGDGIKTKHCYFSADGGTTARAFVAIVSGDELFWNGLVSGTDLISTDRIDLLGAAV